MKPNILVVGSSNTDMILQLDRLPRPGETRLGGDFKTAAGGKGANQAVAAARAGGAVTFIARLGSDAFGDQAMAAFQTDGIDAGHVVRDRRSPSGVALIFVAPDGANCIGVAPGANARLAPADIRRARAAFADARVLLLQLETPLATVSAAADLAVRSRLRIILNPAPAQPLPDTLLRRVSVLTPNETEAELLTGRKVSTPAEAAAAARALRARGPETVIVTLGARGAHVAAEGVDALVPGYPVTPVDTTAAGDVFNGALAVALAENQPLLTAVRFAHAAAALSVTRLGAQPSAPTRRAIDRFRRAQSRVPLSS
jgi:ribokinase